MSGHKVEITGHSQDMPDFFPLKKSDKIADFEKKELLFNTLLKWLKRTSPFLNDLVEQYFAGWEESNI